MVLDYVVDGTWSADYLKPLRLIHPRFAYMGKIMSSTFHEISLKPSQKHWDHSLFRIARYVRKVDMYAASVWSDLWIREEQDVPIKNKIVYDWLTSLWRRDRNRGFICDEMADALRVLPRAESFVISSCQDSYFQIRYPKGDQMIALGFEALAQASKQPKELTLCLHSDQDSETAWFDAPILQHYQFEHLKTLEFEGGLQKEHNSNFHLLLSKCATSLQELYFGYQQIELWPQLPTVTMSALRKLDLFDIQVKLPIFAQWISMCPVLQELRIKHDYCSVCGWEIVDEFIATFTVWKPWFDRIRTHPSRMHLTFDPLSVQNWEDHESREMREVYVLFFVDHNTAEPCHDESFRRTGDAEKDQKCRDVINYMSNAGEWTLNEHD